MTLIKKDLMSSFPNAVIKTKYNTQGRSKKKLMTEAMSMEDL